MKQSGKSRGHEQPRKQSQRRPISIVKQQATGRSHHLQGPKNKQS